ncbi:MAG TPA: response regulator [Verrucomicrobiae bacterium]|nr:response regulator [Verrucomicrobiae bacterium]
MSKLKILIVEDDEALREILETKFNHAGFNVVTATDGLAGLMMALNELPKMIISDVMMPNMDGLTMLEKLRSEDKGKDIPVIMLTNSSEVDTVSRALKNHADDYYVKTKLDLDDLIVKVKEKLRIN